MVSEEFEVIVRMLFPSKTLDRFSKRDLTGSDWKVHDGEGECKGTGVRGASNNVAERTSLSISSFVSRRKRKGKKRARKGYSRSD